MFNRLNTISKRLSLGLAALCASQFSHASSLVGIWLHGNQQTTIREVQGNLLFCNEQGNCAAGFKKHGTLIVPQWSVTGTIDKGRGLILWSNGTQWQQIRLPQKNHHHHVVTPVQVGRPAIAGPWMHEGRNTSIQMSGDGIHFTLINESGQRTEGFVNQRGELELPYMRVMGRLQRQGNVIEWSNGTSWYRP